jgi:aryl-alcohol dehydrogenase-like predicted oxidoreductase
MRAPASVELGLGLIAIGRSWGYRKKPVPDPDNVNAFLADAVAQGMRVLDTAPSYGYSEERLGRFLDSLPPGTRGGLFIATKAGEHWDPETDSLSVDHSYDALSRSVEKSLQRLGSIDLLQLHKASFSNVTSADVQRVLEQARASGVREIGASVTDWETAQIVLESAVFRAVQIPFHLNNRKLEPVFELAAAKQKLVLVNRPFGMGELLYSGNDADPHRRRVEAFRVIASIASNCVILTGTQSSVHLRENILAFQEAVTNLPEPAATNS